MCEFPNMCIRNLEEIYIFTYKIMILENESIRYTRLPNKKGYFKINYVNIANFIFPILRMLLLL